MTVRVVRRWPILALLAGLLWSLSGSAALAAGPEATKTELLPPANASVGAEMALSARVTTASGTPVAGAEVVFSRLAEFMNTQSEIVLGKAVTDKQGVATFAFMPRSEGDVSFTAHTSSSPQYQASSSTTLKAPIATGPAQYVETAGVHVKGVNVMWLVFVLGLVWSVYLTVMGLLALIAREGERVPRPEGT